MGRGNVCVFNEYEGLYYIDNDQYELYESQEEEGLFEFRKDLTYEQLTSGDWKYHDSATMHEWDGIEEYIVVRMMEKFPSFSRCNEWLGRPKDDCRAILENNMFYIALEDNQWSMAVELLEKEDPYYHSLDGLKARHYQNYLNGLKEVLFELFDEIGTYSGAWTSGRIRREEEVA